MARVRDADEQAVRKAAASVTRQISIATCALVVLIVILAVATVIVQSTPKELAEKAQPGETKIYIDAGAVLVALAVIGAGAILFAAAVSWVIARRAVRPLGRALQLQRTFVADASHELRTPLAVLNARVQLLQRRLGGSDPNAGTVAELRKDTETLIGIVDELLAAAGGDDPAEPGQVTDASAVVADAVSALRLLGAQRAVDLELEAPAGLRVAIPETSLRRCVTALVDNALAHSPDGSRVEVRLAAAGRTVVLTVADHGPGIRGIDPERVFERFAHAEPDGALGLPRRRGFGIGLALVRDVAARAGGTVRVERTGPEGTTILLELPAA
ncbi:sensor histidine kinase [Gryllotalpicola ginsengisoli]|uniref:sensor histidine kinase n=1 Tax=Gryllotalpicola ginsengisoli TaxID=444608 RepID=UPI0003B3CE4C|nr:HAMP domain-containing sensor histidine kinase [Gryllotalpicola ginsengisoli]